MAYIQLSKSAFFHNLKQIESVVGLSRLAVVLKDNAYGHGLLEMAGLAAEYGVARAVVRTAEEAERIKDLFGFILILAEIPEKPETNIHVAVNSLDEIKKVPEGSNVHLKVDSGMHRNGVAPDEVKEAILEIVRKKLNLTGIFSHSRSSDELSSEAFWQLKNFTSIKNDVLHITNTLNIPIPEFHFANSATVYRFKKDAAFDMVRVGIGIYGYSENYRSLGSFDLKPVLSLWTEKIASRKLNKHRRLGYGGTYETDREITVSTYDIGYADGFFRLNENHTYHTPDGHRVLGRVSMDNLSLDTDRDEVCIFDDARKLSDIFKTITYEIVVKLPNYLKRTIK